MTENEAEERRLALKSRLCSLPHGEICFKAETRSTNDDAFEGALHGAADLSIFTAYRQTAGRGRMDRKWESVPESSLAVSFLVRPRHDEMSLLNLFSPLLGLAAAAAIESLTQLPPQVKWPNDILIHRRKVSGILCETRWQGATLLGPVLGIGINLRKGSAPKDPDLVYPASSIEDECEIAPNPFVLIEEILRQLLRLRPRLGNGTFFAEWNDRLAYRNELVKITAPGKEPQLMIVRGIAASGDLLVENERGEVQAFTAGEISLRPTI